MWQVVVVGGLEVAAVTGVTSTVVRRTGWRTREAGSGWMTKVRCRGLTLFAFLARSIVMYGITYQATEKQLSFRVCSLLIQTERKGEDR